MKHLYEIFERFPDDSSLWRESALGTGAAQRKLMDMSKKSLNKFYPIDLTSGEVIGFDGKRWRKRALAASTGELRNEGQSSHVH